MKEFLRTKGFKMTPQRELIFRSFFEQESHVTVDELYRFAKAPLHMTYIFWGAQEPFYTRDILPYIRGLGAPSPNIGSGL